MKKWKCVEKNCCPSECEFETTCTGKPDFCPLDGHSAKWEEVAGESEQKPNEPVTDCNQLTTNCSQFPDWCKVGEWVWLDPQKITGANGYEKVTNVDGIGLMFESGLMVCFSHRIHQARLRPWMPEEAIGKVVVADKIYYIISAADKYTALIGNTFIKMDELLNKYKQPDGLLCGVLEHLEDGKWVS